VTAAGRLADGSLLHTSSTGPWADRMLCQEGTLDVPEIDIDEFARRREAGSPVIDVREPDEYQAGHVPGATLIPLATVPDHLADIPTGGEVLVICRSGARSRRAAEFLGANGVSATNVGGGTLAWIDSGRPVAEGDEPG
jgi:rhodanese-related sulfurtransferase